MFNIRRKKRCWYFKRKVNKVGKNLNVGRNVVVLGGESIEIGDNFSVMDGSRLHALDGAELKIGKRVSINTNVYIDASINGRIVIGDNVMIAQNVVIRASDHAFGQTDIPMQDQGHANGEIIIEDDVWICANSVITKDVKIGAHSIVGAGSVVTKDIEPYSIVGGVPAKLISRRK